MPSVSLVVSSYNQLELLKVALSSATEQTTPYDEIIVVDDASSDGTPVFLRGWEGKGGNRRVVLREQNQGLGTVRDLGIDLATSEYVAFLDGDDWLLPEAAARIKEVIAQRQPDIIAFGTRFYAQAQDKYMDRPHGNAFFKHDAFEIGKLRTPAQRETLFWTIPTVWSKVYRIAFLRENSINCPLRVFEDMLWHHQCIVLAEEIECIDKPMVTYRMHEGSILAQQSAIHLQLIDVMDACELFMESSPEAAEMREASHRFQYNLLSHHLLNKDRVPAELKPQYAAEVLKRSRFLALEKDARELEMFERLQGLLSLEKQD